MQRPPRRWLYLTWFAAGLAFDVAAWAVCHALGAPDVSVTVDWAVGLIGMAFAVSLLTGFNLGMPASIRNVGGDAGSYVNTRGGMCLLAFSAGRAVRRPGHLGPAAVG